MSAILDMTVREVLHEATGYIGLTVFWVAFGFAAYMWAVS